MLQTQSFTWKWRHLQDDKIFHRNPCNFSQKSTKFVFMFQRHISCSEYLDFQRLQFHNEQVCCDQENWLSRLQIRCLHIRTHSMWRCQWSQLQRLGSLTAAVQGTRSYYECNLQTQQPGHPQNHCDNKKYDSGKLSVYFVGRTNASDSEDEKLLFKVYNIVHNDIEGVDFDDNEDSVDVNDNEHFNDQLVHGSAVEVDDHFVFILY